MKTQIHNFYYDVDDKIDYIVCIMKVRCLINVVETCQSAKYTLAGYSENWIQAAHWNFAKMVLPWVDP